MFIGLSLSAIRVSLHCDFKNIFSLKKMYSLEKTTSQSILVPSKCIYQVYENLTNAVKNKHWA